MRFAGYQDNYPPDNYPPDNYPQTITPLGQIPPGHLPPLRNYNRLFEILKEHQNNLAPQNVMVDFELAVLNAITTSFPDSSKKGCFFHFSQAIFKKIQSLGLQVRYKDDEDFAHKVRMLAALAFVPEADVIDAFEAVSEDFPLDAQAVIDYFEDTYIGRLRPGGHRFFKSHQMTKVCHNHALPLYLLVFCKICTHIYCDFVPVICVLFVTCKLCDL